MSVPKTQRTVLTTPPPTHRAPRLVLAATVIGATIVSGMLLSFWLIDTLVNSPTTAVELAVVLVIAVGVALGVAVPWYRRQASYPAPRFGSTGSVEAR